MQPAVAKRETMPVRLEPRLPVCTVVGNGQEVRVPPTAWTIEGFRRWAKSQQFPERGRISYIGGEIIIDMSPEEIVNHVLVKGEFSRVVYVLNPKQKRGLYFPDGTLVTNEHADLSTEPDGTFVTWESLESGKVRLIPREGAQGEYIELEGSPDWLLEIVSKYSVRKDTQLLRERYHRARVPEYWLVNARGKKIDFRILVWKPAGYVLAPARGGWQHSPLFGRHFRLARARNRVGMWQYTLHVKP